MPETFRSQDNTADIISTLITAAAGQTPQQIERKERQVKNKQSQIDLYTKMRNSGYSQRKATEEVNKAFSGGGFLQRFLDRKGNAFEPPSKDVIGASQTAEAEKGAADLAKTQAETAKLTAEAGKADDGKDVYIIEDGQLKNIGNVAKDSKVVEADKPPRKDLSPSELVSLATKDGVDKQLKKKAQEELATKLGLSVDEIKGNPNMVQRIWNAIFKQTDFSKPADAAAAAETPATEQTQQRTGKLRVKRKSDGSIGTINAADFNSTTYEMI